MRAWPLFAALALSACVSTPAPVREAPPPPARPPEARVIPPTITQPLPAPGFRTPEIMAANGLEGVIREDGPTLLRRFGTPRLEVFEGDMRKLQFEGQACVLDIYLYPLAPGTAPLATWVEARRRSDGAEVDRAACVRALSVRQ